MPSAGTAEDEQKKKPSKVSNYSAYVSNLFYDDFFYSSSSSSGSSTNWNLKFVCKYAECGPGTRCIPCGELSR